MNSLQHRKKAGKKNISDFEGRNGTNNWAVGFSIFIFYIFLLFSMIGHLTNTLKILTPSDSNSLRNDLLCSLSQARDGAHPPWLTIAGEGDEPHPTLCKLPQS